jgi:hypothetical protein
MSDRAEGLAALFIILSIMLMVFIFPSLFNKYLSLMYRFYKSLGIGPRSEKTLSARPLIIRIYFGLLIICMLFVFYNVVIKGN